MAEDVWKRLARRIKTASERAERQPDYIGGFRAGANIKELWKLQRLIDELIDAETIRGREQGADWAMLGTSKQQAQQRHKAALARQRGQSSLTDGADDTQDR